MTERQHKPNSLKTIDDLRGLASELLPAPEFTVSEVDRVPTGRTLVRRNSNQSKGFTIVDNRPEGTGTTTKITTSTPNDDKFTSVYTVPRGQGDTTTYRAGGQSPHDVLQGLWDVQIAPAKQISQHSRRGDNQPTTIEELYTLAATALVKQDGEISYTHLSQDGYTFKITQQKSDGEVCEVTVDKTQGSRTCHIEIQKGTSKFDAGQWRPDKAVSIIGLALT